jgi:uncharacterized protein (TIGR02300 family)
LVKAELGEKQLCPSCGAKFYDLNKRPAACPKCASVFDPGDEAVRLRRAKVAKTPVYEQDFEDEEERPEAEAEEGLEEEVEETPELDAEGDVTPALVDEDEDGAVGKDALPDGFSEAEEDLEEETVADDEAPILDIEEDEEFGDDELGEIADGDEDESDR